jgi:hypothetical protein
MRIQICLYLFCYSALIRGKILFVMSETHNCPICQTEVYHWERYPNQVCERCKNKASDAYGRRLQFSNESLSGGFAAFYRGTEEKYTGNLCYIDGVRCYANEHRFGGIVIETVK